MSVTFPRGFEAAGITADLKPSGRPDLALLVAEEGTTVAGLFTTNVFAAAPVKLSRSRIAASGAVRAVLVNSGDANAGRGPQGDADALSTTAAVASALSIEPGAVLACSTGVIGGRFPAARIAAGVPRLVTELSQEGGGAFAESICTTDTVPKLARAEAGPYRVGACGKGAAMIEPRLELATMLAFFATDAPIAAAGLRELAATTLKRAFEELTIDGCTSTNDTVLLLASGAAGGPPVERGSVGWDALAAALTETAGSIAYQMADDAEGGTKVLLVEVTGARSGEDAAIVAKAIANSVLVKTAAFGSDPNPGRLVQALGSSGADFDASRARILLGDVVVCDGGIVPPGYDDGGAAHEFAGRDEIRVGIRLSDGDGRARAVGCDLSYEYVKINAEYTT